MLGLPASFSIITLMARHQREGMSPRRVTTFNVVHISDVMFSSGRSALYIPRCLPDGEVDVVSLHDQKPFRYSSSVISVGIGGIDLISSGIASSARKVDNSGQFELSKPLNRVPSIICCPASVRPDMPRRFARWPFPNGVAAACW